MRPFWHNITKLMDGWFGFIRECWEHADTAVRARPEVRAALRLLPRQDQPGPGRPPLRHRAHVPFHRRQGWRDRVPQRQGFSSCLLADSMFLACLLSSTVFCGGIGILTLHWCRGGSLSPRMTLSPSVHIKDWQVLSHLTHIWKSGTSQDFKMQKSSLLCLCLTSRAEASDSEALKLWNLNIERLTDLLIALRAVKPVKGDAVLFFSLHVDGVPDPLSLHGSCPVIQGEKWSAPKWIHVRSYENPPVVPKDTRGCADKSEHCAEWAAAGECGKNPVYMVGAEGAPGQCRKSCNVCDS